MNKVVKACFASVVSELQQSDIFMTVKARLFETPKANLNGVRITSAFLDEIVENEEKYVGLPLVVDVKALANGRYDHLGHLYDARTGQFHTAQIGSFYKFEKEEFDNGCYLVGYARIAKRNKAVCHAIAELFADGALKFSFEITCGEIQKLEDGTSLIDKADSNYFEGEAIVSFPACEDAVALELVAECDKIADDLRKGENEMTDVKESAEIVGETTEEVEAETPEEEVSCNKKEKCAEDEVEETAAVHVTEVHREENTVYAYDSDTNVEVTETVSKETVVRTHEEDVSIVAEGEGGGESGSGNGETTGTTDNSEPASSGGTPPAGDNETPANETPANETPANDADSIVVNVEPPAKKTAEEMIAELVAEINELKTEIAELKENSKPVFAELQTAAINPFIEDMNTKPKYSLLEKAEPSNSGYSLLERA